MTTIMNTVKNDGVRQYEVVHPLDDVAEAKRSPEGLGHMRMSKSVKLSLYALRGYLFSMGILVAYRLVTLMAATGHAAH